MRVEFHSKLSPLAPCSSLSWSRLMTFFKTNPPLASSLPPLTGGRQQKPPSSIDLSKDNILSTNNRHGIGDHVAARHLVERGEVREAGSADLQPVRLVRAIRDEIDAELALRRFDRGIHLTLGHMHAFGDELEMVDELLHALLHLDTRGRRHLVVVDHHRPGVLSQPVDALLDDAVRLAEFLDAHEIAV